MTTEHLWVGIGLLADRSSGRASSSSGLSPNATRNPSCRMRSGICPSGAG